MCAAAAARPLLILDLDETLVHGADTPLSVPHDFRCGAFLYHKRPGVDAFLETCRNIFDMAVWTSATASLAACVSGNLFGDRPPVFLWARDRCTWRRDLETQETYWVKDLRKVSRIGYDLDRVLMVDNTPRKLERNYGNLVAVRSFRGDPADRELGPLARYLAEIAGEPDLRRLEKRGWRRRGRA